MRLYDLVLGAVIGTTVGSSALAAQAQPAPRQVPTFDANALRLVDSIAEAEFRKDSLGSITVGVVSGALMGLGVGTALAGCMFGVAYADIFGLTARRVQVPEPFAQKLPTVSS